MEHEKSTQDSESKKVTKDPVCSMNITAESAYGKQEYGGRTFYFCSAGCMDKFRLQPSKYGTA